MFMISSGNRARNIFANIVFQSFYEMVVTISNLIFILFKLRGLEVII